MPPKPFALSVKVIIFDGESRCLLLRRSLKSKGNPGKWDFPGGKADPGESFDEALLREVEEETGLRVALSGVAGAVQSEVPGRRVAYLIMEARPVSGQIRLSEEHDEYAWVSVGELANWDLASQFREFAGGYAEKQMRV